MDAARELLKTAGYEFGADGMLSAATPLALNFIHNTSAAHAAVGEAMAQDFAQLGITMTLSTMEWNVFLAERKAGNYDFARNGWIADFNDPDQHAGNVDHRIRQQRRAVRQIRACTG